MTINTDQNAVVIYTMNCGDNLPSYNGTKSKMRYGICFETQAPPIGINMCFLEESILLKGNKYNQKTVYKFKVK